MNIRNTVQRKQRTMKSDFEVCKERGQEIGKKMVGDEF